MHQVPLGADDSAPFTLRELGWSDAFAHSFANVATADDVPARVTAVHRTRVVVAGHFGERSAILSSALRDATTGQRPATGDWVAVNAGNAGDAMQVRAVLPRHTAFTRRAAGEKAVPQIVAANVDRVFIVSALPDDVNVRRLERYVAVAWESGALPVIVLTKSDQVEDVATWLATVRAAAPGVDVIAISVITDHGLDSLASHLIPASTIALLGSSGVGKSTLINHLAGEVVMRTGAVLEDGRGRHTTTHRELLRLPGGVLVIDTPGMRELQLWSGATGLEHAFDDITSLAEGCHFADCAHGAEPGCAVLAALDAGLLDAERLASWRKLSREIRRVELLSDPLAAAEVKARNKSIHRMMRNFDRERGR